jgi:hypothetical protein
MAKQKGNGHLPIYKSYVFRDKDPVIDQLRTMAEDTYGVKINSKTLRIIADKGGPTVGSMKAWFFGKTKRPQNPTVEAAGRAMGYQRVWQRMKDK